jgi:hypothetical protein
MSTGDSPQPPCQQLAPTSDFVCDLCSEPIQNPAEAWGQWYSSHPLTTHGKTRSWGFAIVHGEAHSPSCTLERPNTPSVSDWSLEFLLSADGLAFLLEFFVEREVDADELSRFIMRLFIPGYEQSFRHIPAAIAEGVHEPRCNRGFLTQGEIARIIEEHGQGRFDTFT